MPDGRGGPPGSDRSSGARIVIVIVSFDAPPGVLERCVAAVRDTVTIPATTHATVSVVDTGGSVARRLADADLDGVADVVDTGRNIGFAGALSTAADHASELGAEILVVLNDDVVVQDGWLEPLVAALDVRPDLAAVQPLLVQTDTEPPVINSAGVQIDRFGAGSDRLRGRPVDDAVVTDVEAVTGGAAAWSMRFVDAVGSADGRFFLYYEDVEWCRRGARVGWSFAVEPASRVEHVGSASTHRLGDAVRRLQERNRLWTTAMHGSPTQMARALSLSLRRLRHEPREVHGRALADGLRGAVPRVVERVGPRPPDRSPVDPPPFVRRSVGGVNVFGYHHISSGLGDNARTIARCLRAAGVDVIEIDNDMSSSPRLRAARPVPADVHDTTIAVVTAFEFAAIMAGHPQLRADGRRMIGYWLWELEQVPPSHIDAMAALDEIWVPTHFVRDAYAAVAPGWVPVRRMPYQVPRPVADPVLVDAWRRSWDASFVFVATFDHLSIPERKNPVGAVRAFVDAFGPDDGVRLVVKSINGEQRPEAVAVVRSVVGDRPDIELLDTHLDEADHHALIAAADALVSPHRSEGFGLQPFAALALGTPVVATRYGGVLDYLSDTNALLVDHSPVGVVDGEGIYPVGATWADIDHDGLVDAMRTLVDDSALRSRLIEAGRRTADAWPGDRQLGETYLEVLECAEPRTIDPLGPPHPFA